MLSSNPLTASIDIQKTASTSRPLPEITIDQKEANQGRLGEFADDILNISTLGKEQQSTEAHIQANKIISDIANDVINISSSIGKARTSGNLTNSQATILYNKIAALL